MRCCQKLERHTFFSITVETISEVAEVIGSAKSAGLRIDWLDWLTEEITGKEHNDLIQKANILREQVKEIMKQLHIVEHQLKPLQENQLSKRF